MNSQQERSLKDVIHLYLGCEVQTPTRRYPSGGGKAVKAVGRLMDIDLVINQGGIHFPGENPCDLVQYPFLELKPILRLLEDMTEEEDQIEFPKHNRGKYIDEHWSPECFVWLLSKGFDLFGLIKLGLAVNAKELKDGQN